MRSKHPRNLSLAVCRRARDGVVFELQIVNRWGELVYASSDFFDKWDGTIFGKEAPEDTYFYFIELSGVRYKGSLELRR